MSRLPCYWSVEFIDCFVDRLNEDPEFQREAARFSDTVVLQCLGTPAGKDVRASYTIDAGFVTAEVTVEDAPSPLIREAPFDARRAMARASAPYRIWKELDTGSMTVLGALASPEYRIDGSKLRIMLNLGIINQMSRVAALVPKSY